jgi:hypothetical protein
MRGQGIAVAAFCYLLALATSAPAESGWYLMGPPFDDRGVIVPEAPLKKWSHVESFDSARECEVSQFVRAQRASEILRQVNDDIHTGKAKLTEAYPPAMAAWAFAQRSQCISSNDPRLK